MDLVTQERHLDFPIVDEQQIGAFCRAIRSKALEIGFKQEGVAKIELVGTELATNLIRHSNQGGEILFRGIGEDSNKGIEIISLDKGPGITHLNQMLKDGVSTNNSLGAGLGTINRLSNQFDIYTNSGGTAVLSRIWAQPVSPAPTKHWFAVGGLTVALAGETACGDAWATADGGNKLLVAVIDGLGHGSKAEQATLSALGELRKNQFISPEALIAQVDKKIRHSIGAVMAIALIDKSDNNITYSGIGNVTAHIDCGNQPSGCVSMEGIVGYKISRLRQFKYPWTENTTLVISSDGIGRYAEQISKLHDCRPVLAAAILYRDFARRTDDATIVVIRNLRDDSVS